EEQPQSIPRPPRPTRPATAPGEAPAQPKHATGEDMTKPNPVAEAIANPNANNPKTPALPGESTRISVAGLELTTPKDWVHEQVTGGLGRVAQYKISGSGG